MRDLEDTWQCEEITEENDLAAQVEGMTLEESDGHSEQLAPLRRNSATDELLAQDWQQYLVYQNRVMAVAAQRMQQDEAAGRIPLAVRPAQTSTEMPMPEPPIASRPKGALPAAPPLAEYDPDIHMQATLNITPLVCATLRGVLSGLGMCIMH